LVCAVKQCSGPDCPTLKGQQQHLLRLLEQGICEQWSELLLVCSQPSAFYALDAFSAAKELDTVSSPYQWLRCTDAIITPEHRRHELLGRFQLITVPRLVIQHVFEADNVTGREASSDSGGKEEEGRA
jgi:hypothetical protein